LFGCLVQGQTGLSGNVMLIAKKEPFGEILGAFWISCMECRRLILIPVRHWFSVVYLSMKILMLFVFTSKNLSKSVKSSDAHPNRNTGSFSQR
jgi:hypothetical protein